MPPRIAIGPRGAAFAADAVTEGGGIVARLDEPADGLVWLSASDVDGLRSYLERFRDVRWVQLPFAGVEPVLDAGLFGVLGRGRVWTSAKAVYAEPVAEHALCLALAGLRQIPERVVATSWGGEGGTSLYDEEVVILGGGGICIELLRLLAPFRVRPTVVRRSGEPLPGARRTVTAAQLVDVLPGALVVFVALALTPDTRRIVGSDALRAMDSRAWLVNVARGGHVDTGALLKALDEGWIAGAALDVTDPEPLPDAHPLWGLPNCVITPHTADTKEMVEPLLAGRIRRNVAHFAAGRPLEGLVDLAAGY